MGSTSSSHPVASGKASTRGWLALGLGWPAWSLPVLVLSTRRGLGEVLSLPVCFLLGGCWRSTPIDSGYMVSVSNGVEGVMLFLPVPPLEMTSGELSIALAHS